MLALLGSGALSHHVAEFPRRPADVDLLGTYDEIQEHIKYVSHSSKVLANYPSDAGRKIIFKTPETIYEYEVAWPHSDSAALLKIIEDDYETFTSDWVDGLCLVPSMDILYMLKLSHRFRKNSPHFLKTLNDIIFMEAHNAVFPAPYLEWFKWREKLTYTNSLPKLNVDKKNFFQGDGIEYEWCHDSLHEAIAFGQRPAYLEYAGGEVWSDMKKFVTLPENIKLLGVLEESLVLAAERSQLAFSPPPTERWSFEMALSKVCTSITSGVFRSFAYDNYHKVVAMYDEFGHTYMDKVRHGIETGVVKRLKDVHAKM